MTPVQVAETLTGWAEARSGQGGGGRKQKGDLTQLAAMTRTAGGTVVRPAGGK